MADAGGSGGGSVIKHPNPEIPKEITQWQILPRLPPKSLMRFRSVCKSWRALIPRDPEFLDIHRNLQANSTPDTTHILLTRSDTTGCQYFVSVEIDSEGNINPSYPNRFTLTTSSFLFLNGTQSVNGLVLLADAETHYDRPVYIFSPCTSELITLVEPLPPEFSKYDNFVTYRFGFSHVTNEYKILHVHWFWRNYGDHAPNSICYSVFNLSSNSWSEIDAYEPEHLNPDYFGKASVCLHGTIFWMQTRNPNAIVVFDLENESFRDFIPLPMDYNLENPDTQTQGDVLEVGGCLAVFCDKDRYTIDLWVLKDYEILGWVKQSIILPSESVYFHRPIPFGTIHTGELLLRSSKEDSQYLYNMDTKEYREREIVLPRKTGFWRLLTKFDEKIVLLK